MSCFISKKCWNDDSSENRKRWFHDSACAQLVSISPTCSLQYHELPFYYVMKNIINSHITHIFWFTYIYIYIYILHTVIMLCLRCRLMITSCKGFHFFSLQGISLGNRPSQHIFTHYCFIGIKVFMMFNVGFG